MAEQHPSNEEEDSDTIIIEKGFMALIRKFLASKLVWRGFATILLSLGFIQRELPSKVDVVNSSPVIQQVSKEDFQKLSSTVDRLTDSMTGMQKTLGELSVKLAFISGKVDGSSSRNGWRPSSMITTNTPQNRL